MLMLAFTGPISMDVLHLLFAEIANDVTAKNSRWPELDRALFVYPLSVQTPEYYGIEKRLPNFPMIGLVGRWKQIEIENENTWVQVPLEGDDAAEFEKIIGLSPTRMDEILKEKTRPPKQTAA